MFQLLLSFVLSKPYFSSPAVSCSIVLSFAVCLKPVPHLPPFRLHPAQVRLHTAFAALASASSPPLSDLAFTFSLRSVNLACLPVRLLVFPLLQLSFAHWSCRCCFVGLLDVFVVVAWSFVVDLLPLLPASLPVLPDPCSSPLPFLPRPCRWPLPPRFVFRPLGPLSRHPVGGCKQAFACLAAGSCLGQAIWPFGADVGPSGPNWPLGASLAPWGDLDPFWGLGPLLGSFLTLFGVIGPFWDRIGVFKPLLKPNLAIFDPFWVIWVSFKLNFAVVPFRRVVFVDCTSEPKMVIFDPFLTSFWMSFGSFWNQTL